MLQNPQMQEMWVGFAVASCYGMLPWNPNYILYCDEKKMLIISLVGAWVLCLTHCPLGDMAVILEL